MARKGRPVGACSTKAPTVSGAALRQRVARRWYRAAFVGCAASEAGPSRQKRSHHQQAAGRRRGAAGREDGRAVMGSKIRNPLSKVTPPARRRCGFCSKTSRPVSAPPALPQA
ncbi:hypothetical protein AWN76_016685 [Rhodothermaceae bacterium RA]|nr:hypothetical protein AWN76_016685 [Rhodothermaceae bacterium RA]